MKRFSYISASQQVVFGAGAINRLPELVDGFGFRRIMLCTIPRLAAQGGLGDRVAGLLQGRLVAGYHRVRPHIPESQVEAATQAAMDGDIDAVIGLGGGSPIGMAKAVSRAVDSARSGQDPAAASPLDQPLVPVIAIPTTYAGSEMTPIYGVTRQEASGARKETFTDPRVTPRLVVYDPELTLALPPQMTAASGINALAHCIEAAYSITRSPLSSAAALEGVRLITTSLAHCVADGADLEARSDMLTGAYLGAVCVAMARIGLHHGLCHVLGGSAGVPHGIANAVMLPHALRFNAAGCMAELAGVAGAMGLAGGTDSEMVEKAVDAVYRLIAGINLPQRLRDVGVAEMDLPMLAEQALKSKAVQSNPVKITDQAQTEAVLRAAW
jgi:alcohol dehydrogenase class IV